MCSIHIRRTDKVGSEAAFHGVDEYMKHVEAYFSTLALSQNVVQRRVYVASDDPSVFEEIKHKFVLLLFLLCGCIDYFHVQCGRSNSYSVPCSAFSNCSSSFLLPNFYSRQLLFLNG